ncbi:MAG: hypothetical protein DMF61_08520 [Blastocatellia bacterium AA13]|nr:MAG: hypothetical protein DMF61_08520 [Blastocatellia bacterium AA13]
MACPNKSVAQLVALHEFGALDGSQQQLVLDHLIECEDCYTQVYDLEPIMTAFRRHRAEAIRESPRRELQEERAAPFPARLRSWNTTALMAACLLIVLSVGVLYLLRKQDSHSNGVDFENGGGLALNRSPFADLAIPKPAHAEPSPGLRLRNPDDAFERAMQSYQTNDFQSAAEQLDTLRELGPSNLDEVDFYLGASLLLIGKSQEAIQPLTRSAELSSGARLEASHYYLALAFAKTNQSRQAISELDKCIELNGEHQSAARALRKKILEASQ